MELRRRHASGRETSSCDSSVRAESSPGTLAVLGPSLRDRNELPSPDTASPVGTQSSCASTSGIRYVRGSTRGIALLKARTGGKLTVHIPDGRTGGDDKVSSMLSSHIGALIRQHVPFDTSKWKEVPEGVKSYVMNRVLDDFQLDYDRAEDRFTVTSTMNTAYRMHRNRMFQHYSVFNSKEEALEHPYPEMNKEEWTRVCDLFVSEEFQSRSTINKENRAKLKIVHTSGARSFQRVRALLEKMRALQLQNESEGKSYTEVEIFAEVLGTKTSYVRGLGRSVRSVGSSSSVSFVDLSRKLDEARLQIEEIRARQLEYEAFLVKQSDMEQTMREHLQMMEEQQQKKDEKLMQMMAEQQRKKDEEHRKMMEEQQRTLVEQQERRMQLMAEQMCEQLVEQIRQLQSRSTPIRFG
ncbi:hypothetical protein CJ030_MR1G023799 [Morella rubra]|uniref:Uncharacterized protein n=1 Tax=Morella rubra TaxID=262757 RepID=A0A6A1WQ86_9ROSI|nr:hypothetical protein CJ030_MR1G023799 [Morella rubra]